MRGWPPTHYEYKYLVQEQQVPAMRGFFRAHLVPDKSVGLRNDGSYDVHTLYVDSPTLTLFRASQEGHARRLKLRMRVYDDRPEHPAFLEIKRRAGPIAFAKQRAMVTRGGASHLLRHQRLARAELLDSRPESVAALYAFCDLFRRIDAKGWLYVSYRREAYTSPHSERVRVTFDRQLGVSPYRPSAPLAPPAWRQPVDLGGVVLELKFADCFPRWMEEFVAAFDLTRTALTKYGKGLQTLGAKCWGAPETL